MKRPNLAVLGAQWGDEGKGKIVDLLCEDFDVVARFQGGHNAGHTVKFEDRHYSLHLIPSGILHPDKLCILGNGMVIDLRALLREIEDLRGLGVEIGQNLLISDSAQCILPIHTALDQAREAAAGDRKVGTTGRGIGPAYESKMSRHGVVIGDLLHPDRFRERVEIICRERNALLQHVYKAEPVSPEAISDEYLELIEQVRDLVTDTTLLINRLMNDGHRIMFEGAQGALLDVDHGTYPFVTSSSCIAGGITTGLGIAPSAIDRVIGVVKAYTTRVGEGPFPTELEDEIGEHLRARGNEFGTTTGRPRRTGWLDLPILRRSIMLSGIDTIALTKLDVLDELDEIRVCTTWDGERIAGRGAAPGDLEWKTIPGWKQPTVGITSYEELPSSARDYVTFLEKELEVPVGIISTGPRREETIARAKI
ncbi:MAG: adenylosuccinate synthase [Thermoanaerobaculia bacterium]|nr:adenylosuccinate synthase [Thermoanaerobaculia bacterium]